MDILHTCCAGLDVHKKTVVACLRRVDAAGQVHEEIRTFGTMTCQLAALADWLAGAGVTHVAMESTGVYWKPVFNLLEGRFPEVILVNAQHMKQVAGRKTDVKDCQWIAQLLQFGLLRASFIPPRPQRELRELTRQRTQLVRERAAAANRVQKILEDANIKLASVATDVLGVSGLDMLRGLIAGEQDVAKLAQLARGRMQSKVPQLEQALQGRLTETHRFLLQVQLDHITSLDALIERLSGRIRELTAPFVQEMERLDEIPGVDRRTAENVVAEMGTDMSRFPSADHLASWAGVCPGNNESAGKQRSGRTRRGNTWLRTILTQSVWGASRKKNSYLPTQFRRLKGRRGAKRAAIAVAHTLLVIMYHVLKDARPYQDLGPDYLSRLHANRLTKSLVKRLEKLGHKVTLEPAVQAA
jgi:transposase